MGSEIVADDQIAALQGWSEDLAHMQAKIEHYVRELGFTEKDIEHLRALLLEN